MEKSKLRQKLDQGLGKFPLGKERTHTQTYLLTDSTGAEAQKEWRSFFPQPWKLRISNFHACRIVVFKTGFHSGLIDQVPCQLRRVAQPHDYSRPGMLSVSAPVASQTTHES